MPEALATPRFDPRREGLNSSSIALALEDPKAYLHAGDEIITCHVATGRQVPHIIARVERDNTIVALTPGGTPGAVITTGEWAVLSIHPTEASQ